MSRLRRALIVAGGLIAAAALTGVAIAADGLDELRLTEVPPQKELRAYMIQLDARAAIEAVTAARESGLTRVQAESRGIARRARNETIQQRIATQAKSAGLIKHELFRVGTAYNGIAVLADEDELDELSALPGVKRVVPLPVHELHTDRSVPYIKGPAAWAAPVPGLPGANLTGAGMKIGIIDTGVDYVHTDFGGPGTQSALNAARSPANNPPADSTPPGFEVEHEGETLFPSAKVVGGFDFVGDDYDARDPDKAIPQPDPNPMDCPAGLGTAAGHGTHVAGIAAGYGVDQSGDRFSGDYSDLAAHPVDFRIGPGVAPEADIYSLRVFGCTGATAVVVQAIDWALDPDGDGDTSDRLDVINLSLGAPFRTVEDPTLAAAQNAAEAGMIVVGAAGNGGNQVFQGGSPGAAPSAIAVANSIAAYRTDRLRLEPPRQDQPGTFSVAYRWKEAEVTGELVRVETNVDGCRAYEPGEAAQIAGKVVMVDWRPAPGQAFTCGSADRANHAHAAGAIGLVIADVESRYVDAIGGNGEIPAIYVIAPARRYLLDELSRGEAVMVTFSAEEVNGFTSMEFADTIATNSSRGPTGGGTLKPDLSAPGTTILSAGSGFGNEGGVASGTSMAAPHVAGAMALLKQAKRSADGWTLEHIKAVAMNTADPGIYAGPGHVGDHEAPQRVGAGLIDLKAALESDAAALAVSGMAEVSADFGQLQIPVDEGPFSVERPIEVFNHGSAPLTFDVAFDPIGAPPGVEWTLPDGDSVTVPAGGSAKFRLRLSVPDPAALRHRREPSMAESQEGYRRWWLSEASGAVVLAAAGEPTLRVPAYASLRPAGSLRAAGPIRVDIDGDGEQAGTLALVGANADTGGTGSDDYSSLTAGFELQARSPRIASLTGSMAAADLRHVGVAYDETLDLIYFGIGTWGPNPAPGSFARFNIQIDSDRDGQMDYTIYNRRLRDEGPFTDSFTTAIVELSDDGGDDNTGIYVPPSIAPVSGDGYWGPFDSDVIAIPVLPEHIGLDASNSRFNYRVEASVSGVPGAEDAAPETAGAAAPYLTWDYLNPGISFDPVFNQGAVSELSYRYNGGGFAANGSLGALLLQYLNPSGSQSQSVALEQAEEPDEEPPDRDEQPPVDPDRPGPGDENKSEDPPSTGGPGSPAIPKATKRCRVPRLRGRTVKAAQRALRRANCRLGTVWVIERQSTRGRRRTAQRRRPKRFRYIVRRQSIRPGAIRRAGTRVSIRLVAKPRPRPQRRSKDRPRSRDLP